MKKWLTRSPKVNQPILENPEETDRLPSFNQNIPWTLTVKGNGESFS